MYKHYGPVALPVSHLLGLLPQWSVTERIGGHVGRHLKVFTSGNI